LALIQQTFPQLHLCLSTNGLVLPEYAAELHAHHVRHVTITINAIDPAVGARFYAWVRHGGGIFRGLEAAALLWRQQRTGLSALAAQGVLVKVNTVLVPGINHEHIVEVAREVAGLGAFILNVLPLIPLPGTAFTSFRAPTLVERHQVMQSCSPYIRVMRHCQQCRADAVGFLAHDLHAEFVSGQEGPDGQRSSLLPGKRQGTAARSEGGGATA
jgi:nitrogen fixation protein NifB